MKSPTRRPFWCVRGSRSEHCCSGRSGWPRIEPGCLPVPRSCCGVLIPVLVGPPASVVLFLGSGAVARRLRPRPCALVDRPARLPGNQRRHRPERGRGARQAARRAAGSGGPVDGWRKPPRDQSRGRRLWQRQPGLGVPRFGGGGGACRNCRLGHRDRRPRPRSPRPIGSSCLAKAPSPIARAACTVSPACGRRSLGPAMPERRCSVFAWACN